MFESKPLSWVHLTKVDSTNTWLKTRASTLPVDMITVVYADSQTAGKGQHGKKWYSPSGKNLYTSFFFHLPKQFPYLQNLGQTLAISSMKILKELGFFVQIKWPNDLLLGGRKVGGILAETTSVHQNLAAIVGIGININMPKEMLETIDQPATSLLTESGKEWQIEAILATLATQFQNDLILLANEGFASLSHQMQSSLAFLKERILFRDDQRSFEAICEGIDETGQLILQHQDGSVEKVLVGSMMRKST